MDSYRTNFCLQTLTFIYFLYLTISISAVTGSPTKPLIYHVEEGVHFRQVCNAAKTSVHQEIYWKKKYGEKPRYNGTSLEFANISRHNSGTYTCYLRNVTDTPVKVNNGTVVKVIYVDVLFAAEVTEFYMDQNPVLENDTYTMNCAVTGNPPPVWSIIYNDTEKMISNGTGGISQAVTKFSAQCDIAGVYICTGYNRLNKGGNSTRSANLTVLCPPRPTDDVQYKARALVGFFNFFEMESTGYPYPSYTWIHDGKIIRKDRTIDYPTFSVLQFKNVSVDEYGNYTCFMNNSVGSYTAVYELIPYGVPQRPTNLTVTAVTASSATVHWVSGFDMGTPQHFIINWWTDGPRTAKSYNVPDTSSTHGISAHFDFKITYLKPNTSYTVTVAAKNTWNTPQFVQHEVVFKTKGATEPPINVGSQFKPTPVAASSVFGMLMTVIVVLLLTNP